MTDHLPDDIHKQLARKRLIFTVTTGRSGTGYLANLLGSLPGVTSYHEAQPEFCEVLRKLQSDPDAAIKFWREKKIPQIISTPSQTYIETSHLTCKGFLEPLVGFDIIPDLIFLSRPHRDVAISLFRLDTIPGRTPKALRFYLSPDDPGVLELPNWNSLHDYQLCYWYCLEIERRRSLYRKKYARLGSTIIELSLDELKTVGGAYRLLKGLKLPATNLRFWYKYFIIREQKINTKTEMKGSRPLPGNLKELEDELISLIALDK